MRENNNLKEIHLNDRSVLIINPEGEAISHVVETAKPEPIRKNRTRP